jgi:hypothetical protein
LMTFLFLPVRFDPSWGIRIHSGARPLMWTMRSSQPWHSKSKSHCVQPPTTYHLNRHAKCQEMSRAEKFGHLQRLIFVTITCFGNQIDLAWQHLKIFLHCCFALSPISTGHETFQALKEQQSLLQDSRISGCIELIYVS